MIAHYRETRKKWHSLKSSHILLNPFYMILERKTYSRTSLQSKDVRGCVCLRVSGYVSKVFEQLKDIISMWHLKSAQEGNGEKVERRTGSC